MSKRVVAAVLFSLWACSGPLGGDPGDDNEPGGGGGFHQGGDDGGLPVPEPGDTEPGDDAGTGINPGTTSDAGQGDAGSSDTGPLYVYVAGGGPKISVYTLDVDTGALTFKNENSQGLKPSWIAFHPSQQLLYADDNLDSGSVAAYSISPVDGALALLNRVSSQGYRSVHVEITSTGEQVLVANYGAGTIAVMPVLGDGQLGAASDSRTAGVNAHQIALFDDRWVLVPCAGADKVAQYELRGSTLVPNAVPSVSTARGSQPRHLAFHPSGQYAYLIHEGHSTMSAYRFDSSTGRLALIHSLPTVPSSFTGTNNGSEVLVHPSGRFVYGTNRGHNSVVIYSVDTATGRLSLVGHHLTGGATARHFSLDPSGRVMLVAHQDSNNIKALRVDPTSGTLTPIGPTTTVVAPQFVGIRAR